MTALLEDKVLDVDERVKLGVADISDLQGRTTLRTLALSLSLCGLVCEVEAQTADCKEVTIYAARRASTTERKRR